MNQTGFLLSELITPANIQLNLISHQRNDLLRELVSYIPEISKVPDLQETLLRALQDREQLHSTGIGDGIALPHARNALVGLVEKPVIVFGRHPQGIPFGAIDGKPARIFFLLVAPNVTQHLAMLARISRLLRDPKVREDLLAVGTAEKAISIVRDGETKLLK